jgi:hypothetical protein
MLLLQSRFFVVIPNPSGVAVGYGIVFLENYKKMLDTGSMIF